MRMTAAPSACLAIFPVSMVNGRPPMSMVIVSCIFVSFRPWGRRGAAVGGRSIHALRRGAGDPVLFPPLLTEPETIDQGTVAHAVTLLQVIEQAATAADHLEQATAGGMVLGVGFEVLRQVADPLRQ